jgi:hypothetical protein
MHRETSVLARTTIHLVFTLASLGGASGYAQAAAVDPGGTEAAAPTAPAPALPTPLGVVGLDASPSTTPRGIYFIVEPTPGPVQSSGPSALGPGPRRRTVYLNRSGGTFTPGNEDSATNSSIVPTQASTVSGWSLGDQAWTQFVQCLKLQYARFDVEFTEVEPSGAVDYIENVVGGTPGQVQLPANVGGVAPFSNDCSTVERGITFTFAGVYKGNVQLICETSAQEIAHAFGLDHEFLCSDPMTYLTGCGPKSFQDKVASCGEDKVRPCACGGQQNSVQALLQVLGPADLSVPLVEITQPAQGTNVVAGFKIVAAATGAGGVAKVDFSIDGVLAGTDQTAPFSQSAPLTLATGAHTVEVRATDSAGKSSTKTISVTLRSSAPPADPGDEPEDPSAFGGCAVGGVGQGPGRRGGEGEGGADPRGLAAMLLAAAGLVLAWRRR